MSINSTEQKLIKIIAEHFLKEDGGRLTISSVSEKAGISRQSFNSYYKHLKPYVQGNLPISELIQKDDENYSGLLASSQKKISRLQKQLKQIEDKHKKDLEKEKRKYITSLMNDDILLKEASEIQLTLEKQALHNEQLLSQKKIAEQELLLLKARNYDLNTIDRKSSNDLGELIVVNPDFTVVFSNYKKTKDIDLFEDEKDAVLEKTIKKISKFCQTESAEVIIYIERYISDFNKFAKNYRVNGYATHILVRLPVFTRTELRIFVSKINPARPVTVYFPYCGSESIIKAQHAFHHRNVPDVEITEADKLATPSIKDGYEKLVIFRIQQGD